MPDPNPLLDLAPKIAALKAPDRELDMLVWAQLNNYTDITFPTEGHPMTPGRGGRIEAIDPEGMHRLLGFIDPGEKDRNFQPYGGDGAYPHITGSLDAARALIPQGWRIDSMGEHYDTPLRIDGPYYACFYHKLSGGQPDEWARCLNAFTLEGAIAAAALRAIVVAQGD